MPEQGPTRLDTVRCQGTAASSPVPTRAAAPLHTLSVYIFCYFSMSVLVPSQLSWCQKVDGGMSQDGHFGGAACCVGPQ